MRCSAAKARILLLGLSDTLQVGHEAHAHVGRSFMSLSLSMHSSQSRCPFWHCMRCLSFGMWRQTTHSKVSRTILLIFSLVSLTASSLFLIHCALRVFSISIITSSRASLRIRGSSESSACLALLLLESSSDSDSDDDDNDNELDGLDGRGRFGAVPPVDFAANCLVLAISTKRYSWEYCCVTVTWCQST